MADSKVTLPVVQIDHCHAEHAKEAPHPCPYKADVNDDEQTLCTCCEDCQAECADDI